jgi:hypothetical protein
MTFGIVVSDRHVVSPFGNDTASQLQIERVRICSDGVKTPGKLGVSGDGRLREDIKLLGVRRRKVG